MQEQEAKPCNTLRPKADQHALPDCPMNYPGAPVLFLQRLGAPLCPCCHQDAYVALLRPEDVAAGVGACFTAALAQLSGLQDAAAEDVMVGRRGSNWDRGAGRRGTAGVLGVAGLWGLIDGMQRRRRTL